MEWDEGLLRISLIGSADLGLAGLTNMSGVTVNTTALSKSLADMTATELVQAAITIGTTYQAQNLYKGMPNKFAIDLKVYSALAAPFNAAGVATETKLDVFTRTLRVALASPSLEVVGAPLRDYNDASVTTDRYIVFPYDQDVLNFDVSADYVPTNFHSKDGFHFTNTAYGQFYGVHADRPQEILIFQAPIPT